MIGMVWLSRSIDETTSYFTKYEATYICVCTRGGAFKKLRWQYLEEFWPLSPLLLTILLHKLYRWHMNNPFPFTCQRSLWMPPIKKGRISPFAFWQTLLAWHLITFLQFFCLVWVHTYKLDSRVKKNPWFLTMEGELNEKSIYQ